MRGTHVTAGQDIATGVPLESIFAAVGFIAVAACFGMALGVFLYSRRFRQALLLALFSARPPANQPKWSAISREWSAISRHDVEGYGDGIEEIDLHDDGNATWSEDQRTSRHEPGTLHLTSSNLRTTSHDSTTAIPAVGELKNILDGRGIDHANAIEKQDLLDLVLSSGGLPRESGGSGGRSDRAAAEALTRRW